MGHITKSNFRNFFILLGSTLSVLQGSVITPALPKISEHFYQTANIEFLTKLIIALPPLTIALFSPFAGHILEKYGRKYTLIIASLLYAIMGTSGFYLNNIYFILIGRALLGITIAFLMSGFIVVLGDLFQGKTLSKYMGIQGALMSFAGMFFLLIGGKLTLINWNYPFLVYSSSTIISIGLLLFLDETKQLINKNNTDNTKVNPSAKKTNFYWLLNTNAFFIMVVYLMIPTQLPFLLKHTLNLQADQIGVYMALWILSSSIASFLYSAVKSKLNFYQIYSLGFFIWFAGFLLLALSNSSAFILFSLTLSGFGNGLVVPNLKNELLEIVPWEQRGKQSGVLTSALYLGQFCSPILVQPLAQYDIKSAYLVFSILILIVSIYYFIINRKTYKIV